MAGNKSHRASAWWHIECEKDYCRGKLTFLNLRPHNFREFPLNLDE